jgi:hypothetical protein
MRIFEIKERELLEELGDAVRALPGASVHKLDVRALITMISNWSSKRSVNCSREMCARKSGSCGTISIRWMGPGERVAMLIAGATSKGAREILQQEGIIGSVPITGGRAPRTSRVRKEC